MIAIRNGFTTFTQVRSNLRWRVAMLEDDLKRAKTSALNLKRSVEALKDVTSYIEQVDADFNGHTLERKDDKQVVGEPKVAKRDADVQLNDVAAQTTKKPAPTRASASSAAAAGRTAT